MWLRLVHFQNSFLHSCTCMGDIVYTTSVQLIQTVKLSYTGSFRRSIINGRVFMGQDCAWRSKSDNSPCHPHPLFPWRQNTQSILTWRRKCLFNMVLKCGSLHSGHAFPSRFILIAASCERCLPQQAVRWGWRSKLHVTGQRKSSGGCSTKEISSSTRAARGWSDGFLNIICILHEKGSVQHEVHN